MPPTLKFASVVGRPIGASRTPLSVIAMKSIERMALRETELRRKIFYRCMTGVAIIVAVLAVGLPALICCGGYIAAISSARHGSIEHPFSPVSFGVVVGGILLVFSFIVATMTRKESRSDVANQVMEHGSRSSGSDDDPLLRLLLIVIMIGLIYGEFLVIDAIKATCVRTRLRGVDRHRAAMILATVLSRPIDIDTSTLLRIGESPLELRRVLAYLIAYEWVDISADGRSLRLLSPARRALRE